MKFSCLQENLAKGIQTVFKAVPSKSSMPILANVLISAEGGRLKLGATNTETTITTFVGASIEVEGAVTIPAKQLRDFIVTISPNVINGVADQDTLTITSKGYKAKFNGVNVEDYPALPEFNETETSINLSAKMLNDIIGHVAFATRSDDARPVYSGICIYPDDQELVFAATDGFRLSEVRIQLNEQAANLKAIVPAKTISEIAKIFSGTEDSIKIQMNASENQILFHAGDTFAMTSVMEGTFPDYKRIIPKEHIVKATFNSADFLEALKVSTIFLSEATTGIKVEFNPEGKIIITNMDSEMGSSQSELDAEVEGELTQVAFTTKHLMDYFNNVKSEKTTVSTNSNNSPCLLKAEGHDKFLHVLMPIQT